VPIHLRCRGFVAVTVEVTGVIRMAARSSPATLVGPSTVHVRFQGMNIVAVTQVEAGGCQAAVVGLAVILVGALASVPYSVAPAAASAGCELITPRPRRHLRPRADGRIRVTFDHGPAAKRRCCCPDCRYRAPRRWELDPGHFGG
jgi:hypothetical protein